MPTITRDRCSKHDVNHGSESKAITPRSHEPSVTQPRETQIDVGIEQILGMRVGCWRPPVYVGARSWTHVNHTTSHTM
jgi:hypothetical protein